MNLIRTLLAVVSFSVLLIACASPTGLAVGADSGENTPINSNNSVSTQIIANEISDLSSNANIMEQNQEVIVDSLTQMASIQANQENMMEQFQQELEQLYTSSSNDFFRPGAYAGIAVDNNGAFYVPNDISGPGPTASMESFASLTPPLDIDFESIKELDTKMEFIEQLVVGQIADSALDNNDVLSEITKFEQEIQAKYGSEFESLREENEKANEKALKISEDSNKEIDTKIEIINNQITALSKDTSNVDLFKELNDLKAQLETKNDQIANLELENKKLSERLSDFIFHYNSSNQMNKFSE